jgi:hypothetical protein
MRRAGDTDQTGRDDAGHHFLEHIVIPRGCL